MYIEFASIRESAGVAAVIGGRQEEREIEAIRAARAPTTTKCEYKNDTTRSDAITRIRLLCFGCCGTSSLDQHINSTAGNEDARRQQQQQQQHQHANSNSFTTV
ncbi:hypothetical protein ACLKA6_010338 [Drosophila palustris]